MNAKLKSIGSDLAKIDAHVVQADEYEELPELTDAFFIRADEHVGDKLVRRGRPPSDQRKRLVSIRYDEAVIEGFKATGPGWQARMNTVLSEWLETHR